jgi:hypothetical protein
MDYSLLVIISRMPKEDDEDYQRVIDLFGDPVYCNRIFKSSNSKYVYCLGLIDYLQKFNLKKFLENKYKSILYGNDIKFVSSVDPQMYKTRILEFTQENLFISQVVC